VPYIRATLTTLAYAGRRRPRVLLVEDHASLAQATAEFLKAYGLDVRIANSGEEALDAAAEFRPEIVVCDMRLPDLSGLDVARTLRARCETSNAVLAISTALSDGELRFLGANAHRDVDLFLPKPLSEAGIRTLLAASATRQSHRESAAPDLTN
jgi:DNA-binding response OmpR family regulator